MAQVNVDLSEYDMLREAKAKAESQVKELTEEIKKLKDNAANVVVKNRYYMPTLNYKGAAMRILRNLGERGIANLLNDVDRHTYLEDTTDPFTGRRHPSNATIEYLAETLEHSLVDLINWRESYRLDNEIAEIRGFDELQSEIQAKLEEGVKLNIAKKQEELEIAMQKWDAKKLDIDKEVEAATDLIKSRYEKRLDKANERIEKLEEELKEASKSSEEKLAEAIAKLHAAEEEVAKYKIPRKKLFRLF